MARKLIFTLFFYLILICFISPCLAEQFVSRIEIPSSPNPVGSGARALGMGGAFIAVADDATAASWNPGGLIQLELPEISIVGAGVHRIEDNTFSLSPEGSGDETVSRTTLNYLSAACPFSVRGHNMIVSVNYQHLFDFTREWDFSIRSDTALNSAEQSVSHDQEGQLSAYGLAYCVQVTPEISLGLTLNFWEDGITSNRWKRETIQQGSGVNQGDRFTFESRNVDRYSFSGFNTNFGLLWNITPRLTLGAVLKTPFEADLDREHTIFTAVEYPDLTTDSGTPQPGSRLSEYAKTDETLTMPMSYGIGIAYRFSNELTGSLDVYRTEWDDFELEDADGNKTSPITGKSSAASDVDPTHQVRLGAEYLIKRPDYIVPIRAGVFYDPAPAEDSPDDIFGFSIGSGIAVKRLTFDVAYQYRFGNDVGTSVLKQWGFSQDLSEHTLYSSVVIHF